MTTAKRFLLSGRVQGVGFRFYAEDAAQREGIHGFVRNLPDGAVEIVAEGDREALERFEWAIRRGPRGARVEQVNVEERTPTGSATGFTIRG